MQCRSVKSKVPVESVMNQTIPGPDGNHIPVRIYHPKDAKPRKRGLPILVFCHGGGFFGGSLETHDDLCRNLGHLSAYIVVSVDYRYQHDLHACVICMCRLSLRSCLHMLQLTRPYSYVPQLRSARAACWLIFLKTTYAFVMQQMLRSSSTLFMQACRCWHSAVATHATNMQLAEHTSLVVSLVHVLGRVCVSSSDELVCNLPYERVLMLLTLRACC